MPDIAGSAILQNDLEFDLMREDEIFGSICERTAYPYRASTRYIVRTERTTGEDWVVWYPFGRFLSEYGGRLWELGDEARKPFVHQ